MYRFLPSHALIGAGLLAYSVLFTACSNNISTPQTYSHGGLITMTVTEDTETSIIKSPEDIHKFCAARESDAIAASQNGISLGFGTAATKETIGVTSGSGALSLGGRDPLVLITREFMYRVCELSLNHNLSKEETITLYKHFIDKLIAIAPLTKADGARPKGIMPAPQSLQQDLTVGGKDKDSDSFDSKSTSDSFDSFNKATGNN